MSLVAYQGTKDKDDHEEATNDGLTVDVTKAHGGHGDQRQVHTLPVRQPVGIGETPERVPGVLHLVTTGHGNNCS